MFAPDEGRGSGSGARSAQALLLIFAVLWALVLAAGIHLLVSASTLRGELEARMRWIDRAESIERAAAQLSSPQPGMNTRFATPESFAAGLAAGEPWSSAPADECSEGLLAGRQASALVLAACSSVEGKRRTPETEAAFRDLRAASHGLYMAISDSVTAVRYGVIERTLRLNDLWNRVYAFGGVSVFTLGALIAMLWTMRHEKLRLRVRENHFRTLVQTAQDLIWAADAEGRWTFLNEAARRIYGCEPEDLIGSPLLDLAAPERVERDRAKLDEVLAGEPCSRYETVHVRKDGSRVVLLYSATVVRDVRGRVLGAMGSATDVTDLRRMQEQVLLHERLQAVATLGGGVAHDFNNLLTVIIGQAQVAKAKERLSPQLDRRLNSILDTAERARRLTQQLISFARRRPSRHEVIDLVAVIRQMGDLLRNLVGDSILLRESLPASPVRVRADWGQIDQVVMNFVVNSRDAMPRGGKITVTVGKTALDAAEAGSLGIPAGDWAVLDVTDDGEGMEPEVLERIFEPFFTTKDAGKGTGLGLANVFGVVSQHGGTVRATSEPGRGTTMRVYLPLATGDQPTAPSAPAQPQLSQTFPVSV